MTAITDKYNSLGGASGFLGAPKGDEAVCPDGIGKFRHYAGGSIYWSPQTGAHEVHGLIRKKWAAIGWERSPLGYPKTDERQTEGGRYSLFQRGVALWKTGATEAFEVHGAILGRYISLGSEKGFLGFPRSDERTAPDSVGRYSHFEHGSIYWKPSIGAHEVHGLIRSYWADGGWEKNPSLGYPISNEMPTKSGDLDRFSDFENGVLFWASGSSNAVQLAPNDLCSRSSADVVTPMGEHIKSVLLAADSRIYVTKGPTWCGLTDYSQGPSAVRNRMYHIDISFGISLDNTNDPDCDLRMTIELRFDRESRTVQAVPRHWRLHTELDWPTTWLTTPEEVNSKIAPKLNAHIDKPIDVAAIPPLFNVLSLKVTPNGDLNCYTEPN